MKPILHLNAFGNTKCCLLQYAASEVDGGMNRQLITYKSLLPVQTNPAASHLIHLITRKESYFFTLSGKAYTFS